MVLDVLEYEVATGFPELGSDLASWTGYRYTESNRSFIPYYKKAFDKLLQITRKLSRKISEANDQLKSIEPLSDNDERKAHVVDLYNEVCEMHRFSKNAYNKVKMIGSIEPEIDSELKGMIMLLHEQRKILTYIIEGNLREAITEHSKSHLNHRI